MLWQSALCLAVVAVLGLSGGDVVAQGQWPTRPVKFVVPAPPGGGTDLYARLLASELSESLKQSFVVENRPGAGGNIGAEVVAKAPADGHTFLVSATGTVAVNPILYRNLPFDVERDLVPVARGVTGPFAFIAHAALPARSLGELVAMARSEPEKVAFASGGTGSVSYLAVRLLEERTGVRFRHVPYKGLGQAYQDLVGGHVSFMFADIASSIGHIRGGKVRALAVTEKSELLPHSPTVAESGIERFHATNSFSVFAPGGTPMGIVERLNASIATVMRSAALGAKLRSQAMVPVYESPADFAASLRLERNQWKDFIERNRIALEQ